MHVYLHSDLSTISSCCLCLSLSLDQTSFLSSPASSYLPVVVRQYLDETVKREALDTSTALESANALAGRPIKGMNRQDGGCVVLVHGSWVLGLGMVLGLGSWVLGLGSWVLGLGS